ncbi:unnamed protein product, partial [Orchesella dallaii]
NVGALRHCWKTSCKQPTSNFTFPPIIEKTAPTLKYPSFEVFFASHLWHMNE